MNTTNNSLAPTPAGAAVPAARPWPREIWFALAALAILAEVLVLIVACGLFAYTHPIADDYSRAGRVKELGFWGSVHFEYFQWSGRWVGTGLEYLSPAVADISRVYPYWVVSAAIVFAACLHFFLATVLQLRVLGLKALLLTVSFLCLYWTGMPSVAETFYWFPGAAETHGAIAFTLLILAALLRTGQMRTGGRIVLTVALALLVIITDGMHEMFGMLLCMLLAIGAFVSYRRKTGTAWLWGVVLVAAVAGILVVVLAPGNAFRLAKWPNRGQVGLTLSLAWEQALAAIPMWLRDGKLWAATLALLLVPGLNTISPTWCRNSTIRWKIWIPVIWVAALGICFCGTGWAMGDRMPPRVRNAVYMIFLIGWLLTAMAWSAPWRSRLQELAPAFQAVAATAVIVWSLSLVTIGNTPAAYADFRTAAPEWDRFIRQRDDKIRTAVAAGATDLIVDRPPVGVQSYYPYDLSSDPSHWVNDGWAKWFGLKTIRVRGPNDR